MATAQTWGVRLSATCLQQDMLPILGMKRTMDILWPHITGIHNPYNSADTEFVFTGSTLVFQDIVSYDVYKQRAKRTRSLDTYSIIWNRKFFVPRSTIAARELDDYRVVAADRDVSQYGNCAKTNFTIGMSVLSGWVVLRSGAVRNANQHFSNLPGYCTGASDQVYKFYQGICGVTSMIFRASMLEPTLYVTKRYGHTNRYTRYYGEIVRGDDAAIYEDIKQFEIQNTSPYQIIMRSVWIGQKPFVILVSDHSSSVLLTIQKKSLSELSAQIVRTRNGITKTWTSVYDQKVDTAN